MMKQLHQLFSGPNAAAVSAVEALASKEPTLPDTCLLSVGWHGTVARTLLQACLPIAGRGGSRGDYFAFGDVPRPLV